MDKCSRCGGNHGDLYCLYFKVKNNYSKSNIDLQTSNLQSCILAFV